LATTAATRSACSRDAPAIERANGVEIIGKNNRRLIVSADSLTRLGELGWFMIASYRRAKSRGEDSSASESATSRSFPEHHRRRRTASVIGQISPVLRHAARQRPNRLLSRTVNRSRENFQPELYFLPILPAEAARCESFAWLVGHVFFVAPCQFFEKFLPWSHPP